MASRLQDIKKAVFWPDRRTFQDLWPQIKLGLPGIFMTCLDGFGDVAVDTVSGWISTDV